MLAHGTPQWEPEDEIGSVEGRRGSTQSDQNQA